MTLSTNVAIRLPEGSAITPAMVLDKAIEALHAAADDGEWGPDHLPITEKGKSWDGRHERIQTVLGQGFYAITEVEFNADGSPLYEKDVTHRELYPEDYEDEPAGGNSMAYPACTYLLDMDTAYGCRFNHGLTAWTLHLAAILQLRDWLKTVGGTLMFQDESTGQWFDGNSSEGFKSVVSSGDGALNWFRNVVQPIVEAEVAAEGGTMIWHGE